MNKGKFLKVVCPKCGNNQIVFGKASMGVKCDKCKYMLMKATGGKTKVKARVKEVLWN